MAAWAKRNGMRGFILAGFVAAFVTGIVLVPMR
jgi:hypothetical protein